MQLTIHIDEKSQTIEIPETILENASDFFQKMDKDMDNGWQMSREWVQSPSTTQRCQIAADRLMSALSSENETMLMLMCGYILLKLGDVKSVHIDTEGDMKQTEFA